MQKSYQPIVPAELGKLDTKKYPVALELNCW